MKEFLHGYYRMFGLADCGIGALVYSIYLKVTKKLPYTLDLSIRPEAKAKFIKIESRCLMLDFMLMVSLLAFMTFSNFNVTGIIFSHIALMIMVFFVQIYLEKDLYY